MNPTAWVHAGDSPVLLLVSGEGAMAGGVGRLCYGVLGHQTTNGWHGKAENLTTMRMEGSAASGEAPKGLVDGGGDVWRERRVRVRLNPRKTRPQRELDDTYCFGGTRRRSPARRRRGLRRG